MGLGLRTPAHRDGGLVLGCHVCSWHQPLRWDAFPAPPHLQHPGEAQCSPLGGRRGAAAGAGWSSMRVLRAAGPASPQESVSPPLAVLPALREPPRPGRADRHQAPPPRCLSSSPEEEETFSEINVLLRTVP